VSNYDIKHLNTRLQIQAALFDPSKSTDEIVLEGMRWAKQQVADKPLDSADEDDFDRQWDHRAVIMAASLAVRDYSGQDRAEVVSWALPLLDNAAAKAKPEHPGNDQIQYSEAAIAALGYIALHKKEATTATLRALLQLAAHKHPAVQNAIFADLQGLQARDARLTRSLVRISMASAAFARHEYDEDEDSRNKQAQENRIAAAIAAEQKWLCEAGTEPGWPDLPPWVSFRRRGIRLPGGRKEEEKEADQTSLPELEIDEQRLGRLIGHLVPLTLGDCPRWLVELCDYLMRWSVEANGPQGDDDGDRDHRPTEWNGYFFDFLGILGVALPHERLMKLFLEPMRRFTEEAFLDAAATFLRGFDRATLVRDTRNPENPAAVREFLSQQIRGRRTFRRLSREKSVMAETHLGDALNAIFYQPSRWGHHGKAYIPEKWDGLPKTMPVLTELVKAASPSGYIATTFVTMIEASPSPELLPFVVAAMTAWRAAYGDDSNFWIEKGIGTRVCAWLEKTLRADEHIAEHAAAVREELSRCLDTLVRAGIAQANAIEKLIENGSK
jgi:hypothetical protein